MKENAGFWMRFAAWIIDKIILGTLSWIVIAPILTAMGIATAGFSLNSFDPEDIGAFLASLTALIGLSLFINECVRILYHSLLEASKYQGSIGKIALGLIVTDAQGQKLDFPKALIRNLCKIISDVIFGIGYIMAGFTEKKQALHDLIAGTLVTKK